ncbi:MAG: hypothetical protein CBC46_03615 [Verrucomicrobiaceae bacterium TMED86]|nr:MAG: hypothetical protein CBC46_03615 [Verrucomicrobiaceae bacterium TMED86]
MTRGVMRTLQDYSFAALQKALEEGPKFNYRELMKRFSSLLILCLVSGCTTTSELVEDIFMPNYRRILDGDRTYYYMHPSKPNKFSDKKKWQVYFKDEKLISSTSWKPDGQKCPETNVINGNGLLVLYNEDGTELSRSYYKNGKPKKIKNP